MEYEWDENKNKINLAKNGLSFITAQMVFDDLNALSIQDRHEDGEERWQTIGLIGGVAILLVAHTYRERNGAEVTRIISARKANKQEKKRYEQGY